MRRSRRRPFRHLGSLNPVWHLDTVETEGRKGPFTPDKRLKVLKKGRWLEASKCRHVLDEGSSLPHATDMVSLARAYDTGDLYFDHVPSMTPPTFEQLLDFLVSEPNSMISQSKVLTSTNLSPLVGQSATSGHHQAVRSRYDLSLDNYWTQWATPHDGFWTCCECGLPTILFLFIGFILVFFSINNIYVLCNMWYYFSVRPRTKNSRASTLRASKATTFFFLIYNFSCI
jgi:hypothetical protein